MSHIEDAMRGWVGEQCSEFEPGCACCQGWAEVDEIDRLRAELAECIKARDAAVAVADLNRTELVEARRLLALQWEARFTLPEAEAEIEHLNAELAEMTSLWAQAGDAVERVRELCAKAYHGGRWPAVHVAAILRALDGGTE